MLKEIAGSRVPVARVSVQSQQSGLWHHARETGWVRCRSPQALAMR